MMIYREVAASVNDYGSGSPLHPALLPPSPHPVLSLPHWSIVGSLLPWSLVSLRSGYDLHISSFPSAPKSVHRTRSKTSPRSCGTRALRTFVCLAILLTTAISATNRRLGVVTTSFWTSWAGGVDVPLAFYPLFLLFEVIVIGVVDLEL
ncbi:hypothetical protein BT69DRAFT_964540 [Atractiella rhizophila]|nr:hypothetical protein BT69DRAFT_964540 [Atractiella rhizophila]